MIVYLSNADNRFAKSEKEFYTDTEVECGLIKVYENEKRQEILGFGGALTEASAYTFHRMGKESKEALLNMYFGDQGNRYNFCRLPIQSCDFSLGNSAYVTEAEDGELSSFTLAQDEKYVIPFIKAALSQNGEIEFLGSPWSPPAFMKSNQEMNNGGKLPKEYYDGWALVIVKYIEEYRKHGIKVNRITVQNEPKAVQIWDS